MDKIIIIIVLYYIFKHLFRFLSSEQEKGKGTMPHPPIKHHRPPDAPIPKGRAEPPRTPDFPKSLREFSQILQDLKREADIPKRTAPSVQIPHQAFPKEEIGRNKREVQKRPVSVQREPPATAVAEEEVSPADIKITRKEKTTGLSIGFDQPELFLHGIILSEILRPPLSMRTPLVPPYMR